MTVTPQGSNPEASCYSTLTKYRNHTTTLEPAKSSRHMAPGEESPARETERSITSETDDSSRWRPRSFESFFHEFDQNRLLHDMNTSPLSTSTPSVPTSLQHHKFFENESAKPQSSSERPTLAPRKLSFNGPYEHNSSSSSLYHTVLSMSAAVPTTRPHVNQAVKDSVDFLPLQKSYSDGGIDVTNARLHRRGSSPLKILAVRKNLETNGRRGSISMDDRGGYPGSSAEEDQAADSDYDSEKGSASDCEQEDEVQRGKLGLDEQNSEKTSRPVTPVLRRRIVWRRGESSSSSTPKVKMPDLRQWLRRNAWWILTLAVLEALFCCYIGYVQRAAVSRVSLQDFGGFIAGICYNLLNEAITFLLIVASQSRLSLWGSSSKKLESRSHPYLPVYVMNSFSWTPSD